MKSRSVVRHNMATAMRKSPRPSSLATRYRLFYFIRGHGQNRAWRVAHDALRHAPTQGIDDAMLTFGGHDDEIRLLGRIRIAATTSPSRRSSFHSQALPSGRSNCGNSVPLT